MFGQQLAGRLGVTLLPGKTDGRALASRPHIQRQVRIPLLMIQCVARQPIINHKTAEGPIGLVDLSHSFFTILSLNSFLPILSLSFISVFMLQFLSLPSSFLFKALVHLTATLIGTIPRVCLTRHAESKHLRVADLHRRLESVSCTFRFLLSCDRLQRLKAPAVRSL